MATLSRRRFLHAALAVALSGCRELAAPLGHDVPEAAVAEPEATLLRIAANHAAWPLARDLSAARAGDDSVSHEFIAGDTPSPIELLAGGSADLALLAVPTDGMTPPSLPEAYATYRPVLLAFDALGLMVRQNAALRALTLEELRRLYGGYVLDWSTLQAGTGQPELVGLPRGTASRERFGALLGVDALSSTTLLLPSDAVVVDYLAEHALAVGFASVANRDERVHLVALDGVLPTPKGVARGTYPYTWAVYALISPQAPPQAAQWLAFAAGAKGRDVIAQRYALPK